MPSDADLKKRVGRKLTKKKKEGHEATMSIPERFRDGDDADEDITAMPGGNPYMNQSVFGMIAAAGSQVDFNARFDAQSSDEEDADAVPSGPGEDGHAVLRVDKQRKEKHGEGGSKQHRRKFSDSKLLQSFSRLGSSKSKSKSKSSPFEGSPSPKADSPARSPSVHPQRTENKDSPVMSRMLEAKRELSMRQSSDVSRRSRDELHEDAPSSLAQQLMEIFAFEQAEDVIEGEQILGMLKCIRIFVMC